MKRFWKTATTVQAPGGFAVTLDGRPVRTPARAELIVPTAPLAEAIAAEWDGCGDTVDPRRLPLTGLANAAIDRVAADAESFATQIARYGETDLLCYRAEGPATLVQWQAEHWDALLAWARRRYDVDFACQTGVIHISQPADTLRRLSQAVAELDPFRLAGLASLVTVGGSLVAGLAVLEAMIPAEEAWDAVSLDDRWQLEQWGEDGESRQALDSRRCDFLAAARFLELLSSDAPQAPGRN